MDCGQLWLDVCLRTDMVCALCLQLDIRASVPSDFLTKAKEIVMKHRDLQSSAEKMQMTVSALEQEHTQVIARGDSFEAARAHTLSQKGSGRWYVWGVLQEYCW